MFEWIITGNSWYSNSSTCRWLPALVSDIFGMETIGVNWDDLRSSKEPSQSLRKFPVFDALNWDILQNHSVRIASKPSLNLFLSRLLNSHGSSIHGTTKPLWSPDFPITVHFSAALLDALVVLVLVDVNAGTRPLPRWTCWWIADPSCWIYCTLCELLLATVASKPCMA